MVTDNLAAAIAEGTCLVDSQGQSTNHLHGILASRLARYYQKRGSTVSFDDQSLEQLQIHTAREALAVVIRIQQILLDSPQNSEPLLGARDSTLVRTLISIVFRWGPGLLLVKTCLTQSENVPSQSTSKIREIDTATQAVDYQSLTSMTSDILSLVFNGSEEFAETEITSTILQTHPEELLLPCLTVGWLPKVWTSTELKPVDTVRPKVLRLLNKLSPYRSMIALGAIQGPRSLPHVRKLSASLLTGQLLRPQGLKALVAAIFGEEEATTSERMPEKLEQIVKILTKTPAHMEPKEYLSLMLPRIIDLLAIQESPTNKRVGSWVISRILSENNFFPQQDLASQILLSDLHKPFLVSPSDQDVSPSMTMPKLVTLVSNADPSPTFITSLLSPIVPALYSILYHSDKGKVADPTFREAIQGILMTWGKIARTEDATRMLSTIFEEQDDGWQLDLEGSVIRRERSEIRSSLSLADLASADEAETDFVSILGLYPDPQHFSQFLRKLDLPNVLSELFSKLLGKYRGFKSNRDDGGLRSLHCLQMIMQIQSLPKIQTGSSSTFLKPTPLLAFIKSVLEPSTEGQAENSMLLDTGRKHPAAFLEPTGPSSGAGDSDDEDEDVVDTDFKHEDELIVTSLTLLLSVLEGNEDLSVRTDSILNDIFTLLDPLTTSTSSEIARLAREAKVTITARSLSSASGRGKARPMDDDDPQAIYQKALKLIQDPILPVRAHGLLLLRQLVSNKSWKDNVQQESKASQVALSPAILSIFMQFVMDDDSYLYLNAVQGLAAMVNAFGKDVLKGLLRTYCGDLEGLKALNMSQKELDVKVRVGEALGSVIQRCGETLALHADILLPPLLGVLRTPHLPTTLRMSAISLLADCQRASTLAVLPYLDILTNAMIDLLQTTQGETESTSDSRDINTASTSRSTSFSPFRRAALHFVSVVIREVINQINDGNFSQMELSGSTMKRLQSVLSYLAATDEDRVTRVMAKEASSEIEELHLIIARQALVQFQM